MTLMTPLYYPELTIPTQNLGNNLRIPFPLYNNPFDLVTVRVHVNNEVRCGVHLRLCIQVWVVAQRAVLHVHDTLDRVRNFTQVGVGDIEVLAHFFVWSFRVC